MKLNKKSLIAGALSLSLISIFSTATFAVDGDLLVSHAVSDNVMPIADTAEPVKYARFMSFSGTVKKITETEHGFSYVYLENDEGTPANFIVSDETYVVDKKEIKVGVKLTGYYDSMVPMIMIYPPQYKAEVVVVGDVEDNLAVDVFDKDLISSDGMLKLNIGEDTKITLKDGKAYDGELSLRKLLVRYGASTRSIPAQTTPTEIIVLSTEKDEIALQQEEESLIDLIDASSLELVVNDKVIAAAPAYVSEDKVIMVPVRAISEALGYKVVWQHEEQKVTIGDKVSFIIGEVPYKAELKNGTTYVPLKFFKETMGMNNAYVFEGQIVIDNGELMH